MNFLFERGKVFLSWKLCEIVLVYKKDCMLIKINYCFIIILLVLFKVFEKFVYLRFVLYFEDVYYNNVYVYRDCYGCDIVIFSLIE